MNGFAYIFAKQEYEFSNKLTRKIQSILSRRGKDNSYVYLFDNVLAIQNTTNNKVNNGLREEHFFNNKYKILTDSRIDNLDELYLKYPELKGLKDPEILIKLYEKFGQNFYSEIEGPLSFVIFDSDNKTVNGCRDLFGQKPFYFLNNSNFLIISSEIDIFFEFGIEKSLNDNKVSQFILNEFIKDGESFYKNIQKLNGGYELSYKESILNIKKYIQSTDLINETNLSLQESSKKLKKVIENVTSSMASRIDYNIGSTLSGGLDSSSLSILLCNQNPNKDTHAFSVNFQGLSKKDYLKTYEKNYVDEVLRNRNLVHKEINLKYNDSGPIYSKINYKFSSQPYGIINGYMHDAIFFECKKNNINYLADGLFGDEIISHGIFRLNELLNKGNIVMFIYELIMLKRNKVLFSIKAYVKSNLIKPIFNVFKNNFSLKEFNARSYEDMSFLLKKNLNNKEFLKKYKNSRNFYFKSDRDEQLKLLDSGVIEFALEQLDEIANHNNLENFYPFLDKRILKHALNTPSKFKLRNGITRYYFREAMKSILPKILYRRKTKSNIGPYAYNQIKEYLNDDFPKMVNDSKIVKKYVDTRELFDILKSKKLDTNLSLIVYKIICLERWSRKTD